MGRKKKGGGGGMKGFVKQTRSAKNAEDVETTSTTSSSEATPRESVESTPPQSSDAPLDIANETKSQMRERHKKELNAAKKEAAKLGKKKKQESTELVENVKVRHERELLEYKERQRDSDEDVVATVETSVEPEASTKPSGKKSKSARRREKEAQRMEEREARIREGIAELGVTDRVNEEQKLTTQLHAVGYEIYEIRPDGNCLFKAIEDQLTQLPNVWTGEELRRLAAEEMRSNSDVYLPFYVQDDAETSFLEHCDKIESTAEWGGELEIQALSEKLQRCMVIYSIDLGQRVVGEPFEKDRACIRLCFMQHAYHLGAHYNSVRTKQAS